MPEPDHYRDEVLSYFASKAAHYDSVDLQPYWNLSDQLLWWLLELNVLNHLPLNPRILDAGGGTGRWSIRLLQAIPTAHVTLIDLSPHMTAVAAKKADDLGLRSRLQIEHIDLNSIQDGFPTQSFDLCISFHNVLGFVSDPQLTMEVLSRSLTPVGQLVIVMPNRYHTAWFNLNGADLSGAETAIFEGRGRFTHSMPFINLFTPVQLSAMADKSGLKLNLLTGFPVLLYPGGHETQLYGSSSTILDVLGQAHTFQQVLALEKTAVLEPGVACRGNNLFMAAARLS